MPRSARMIFLSGTKEHDPRAADAALRYAAPGGRAADSPRAAGSTPARSTICLAEPKGCVPRGVSLRDRRGQAKPVGGIRRQALPFLPVRLPTPCAFGTEARETRSGGSFRADTLGTTVDYAHTSAASRGISALCFRCVFPGADWKLHLLSAHAPGR